MTRTHSAHRGALAALAGCLLAGPLVGSASAHDHRPHSEGLDITIDPLMEDCFITDDMEEKGGVALPSGVTCSSETVQSAPNPTPSSPSFVLIYAVPYDTTPVNHFDVPRSCSNGTFLPSTLAKSSRNLATFQYVQNAALHYRPQNITYTSNYGYGNYSTRGARRFISPTSTATWNATKGWDYSTASSPKLTKLRNELTAKGFNVSNTRYSALLDVGEKATCNTANVCSVPGAGAANTGGPYGFVSRYWIDSQNTWRYWRFGCSTGGDANLGHEMTHQVGANHVTDLSKDLMHASGGGATYRSGLVWDHNRNSYQATVSGSTYVVRSNLAGNYYTC